MPEATKPEEKKQPGKAADNTTAAQPAAVQPVFNLSDDLNQLEKLNLMRAVLLRMQGGRHPSAEIDMLLQRRLNLKKEDFQGPYAIRLICTLMMIFLLCSIFWGILWLFATALELNYFIRLMSTAIATLLAATAGIAIFHPSSVPDEKLLKEAIDRRISELKILSSSSYSTAEETVTTDQTGQQTTSKPQTDSAGETTATPPMAASPENQDSAINSEASEQVNEENSTLDAAAPDTIKK